MSDAPVAFWIDSDYDREFASDGVSRYGAYLRDACFEPWTDDDQAVEWAEFAWRHATGPVMSPGYVRHHTRILAAQLQRSGWDGTLIASVSLACCWPAQLTTTLSRSAHTGDQAAYWHDWPTEALGGHSRYYEPGEAELAARPYALTTLNLQFTMPSAALPEPPANASAQLAAAQQAVAVLVDELNAIVSPLLGALLGRTSPAGERPWDERPEPVCREQQMT